MTEEKDKSFKVDVNVTSTLLERVAGSLDRATAGLTKSWRVRREGRAIADARAYEMRLIAQAESDAAAIREGRARFSDDGKLVLLPLAATPPTSVGAPDERADVIRFLTEGAARIANDEALRQTTNLLRTAAKAEDYARNSDAKPSSEEVDPDWLARWRRGAQDVSDEMLQQLWAKLLVDQASAYQRNSMRIIDLLSSLSRTDVELIASLGPYVFADGSVIEEVKEAKWSWVKCLQRGPLNLDEKIYLEELGVVSDAAGMLSRTARSFFNDRFLSVQKIKRRCIVLKHDDVLRDCTFRGTFLTSVGLRLVQLGQFPPNEDYLRSVALAFSRIGLQVQLADWRENPEEEKTIIVYNEEEIRFSV